MLCQAAVAEVVTTNCELSLKWDPAKFLSYSIELSSEVRAGGVPFGANWGRFAGKIV